MNFEIFSAAEGYRARILNGDDEEIFVSPVYESKADAKSVIALVQNAAQHATIEDNGG
jgi:uncharacterized protein YegP (UPF0339 family)